MKSGKSIIMYAILLFSVISTTIVYSAYNTKLQINGEAILRSKNDIRITGLEKIEYSNGVYETYNRKYSKDTINIYVTLPANTSITYEVKVTNKSDIDYVISKIEEVSHNANITYTSIVKENKNIINHNNSKNVEYKFTIKITNNTATQQLEELSLKYTFTEAMLYNYFLALQDSETVIADDGTSDHNMRYTGISPHNYVTFAGEEFRVIGVFNNINNGTGKKETRVKIIKSTSIGAKRWHTSNINIWKNASLNKELQTMSYASNSMVDNAVWYLGDPGDLYIYTAMQAYEIERSTKVASGNDTTWTGKVGLMYPSDYGFAASDCYKSSKTLDSLDEEIYDYRSCTKSNWLFLNNDSVEWLLSPLYNKTTSARGIHNSGYIIRDRSNTSYSYEVRPTVYLKTSVKCTNCNESTAGTQSNPFKIR